MTWNNVRTLLWACMLGSILSVGSVFSLISGFSLPTQNPCQMVLLWVCTAFLCGILFQHTHGKRLLNIVYRYGYAAACANELFCELTCGAPRVELWSMAFASARIKLWKRL